MNYLLIMMTSLNKTAPTGFWILVAIVAAIAVIASINKKSPKVKKVDDEVLYFTVEKEQLLDSLRKASNSYRGYILYRQKRIKSLAEKIRTEFPTFRGTLEELDTLWHTDVKLTKLIMELTRYKIEIDSYEEERININASIKMIKDVKSLKELAKIPTYTATPFPAGEITNALFISYGSEIMTT